MKPGAAGSGSQEEESSGRTSLNWPERCGAMGEKWSQGAHGAWRCWEQSGRGRFILAPQSTLRRRHTQSTQAGQGAKNIWEHWERVLLGGGS